ncbi:integrase [Streptomyces adelaidensis]|uniref:integrase n=1 Tax=Streptomyces adelaidensis TaxID=2796465 RepID=UPI0019048354|nr:integrase [Streptomyces adelaidensis]
MQLSVASGPGMGAVNEDIALTGPDTVVVLDGVSVVPGGPPAGCAHSTSWYVRHLGARLMSLAAVDHSTSLTDVLSLAITGVNGLHDATCDLSREDGPASTVAMIRRRDDVLDYLVLSDSVLLLDCGEGGGSIRAITDDTGEQLARKHLRAVLDSHGLTGSTDLRGLADLTTVVAELQALYLRLRNRPGGYWVASALPRAAEHARTGTLPLGSVRQAALLSDGASRLVDPFGVLTWPALLQVLRDEGPAALIARTREAEMSDPECLRWPRFKRSDDATAVHVRFNDTGPPA